jgi:hypothetical protein
MEELEEGMPELLFRRSLFKPKCELCLKGHTKIFKKITQVKISSLKTKFVQIKNKSLL